MPVSSVDQLKLLAAAPEFPPAVLALSGDSVRLARLKDHLLQLAAQKAGMDRAAFANSLKIVQCGDLNRQTWAGLRDGMSALSLFSQRSFIVMDKVERLPVETARELIQTLPDIPPSTNVFLTGSLLPASHVLLKFFRQKQWAVELEELSGPSLKRWVQKELLQQGGFSKGDASVPDLLIELGENMPDKISQLIELLSLYCDGTTVKTADLRALFPDRTHTNEFQLVDAITRGDLRSVLKDLMHSLRSGKSSLSLLGLIARNLTTLFIIKSLQQRGASDSRIRESVGLPDWLYRKHASSAQNITLPSAKLAISAILRADSRFKNYSLEDDEILMDLFDSIQSR